MEGEAIVTWIMAVYRFVVVVAGLAPLDPGELELLL
jgi:hypothetical protein